MDGPEKNEKAKEEEDEGVEMSAEALLKSREYGSAFSSWDPNSVTESGIIVFNLLSGKIPRKNARLEVLFEDGWEWRKGGKLPGMCT